MPAGLAQSSKALADWGPDSFAFRLTEILHSLSLITVAAEHALFVVAGDHACRKHSPHCRRSCLQKLSPYLQGILPAETSPLPAGDYACNDSQAAQNSETVSPNHVAFVFGSTLHQPTAAVQRGSVCFLLCTDEPHQCRTGQAAPFTACHQSTAVTQHGSVCFVLLT